MKKILSLVLVVTMVCASMIMLNSCKAKEEEGFKLTYEKADFAAKLGALSDADRSAATPAAYKVAMVTDYGDITDESFNQATYEGAKTFCEAKSMSFQYYKPADNSTEARVASVKQAITDGYNVIVMPGYAFAGAVYDIVDQYPNVKFVALDVSAGDLEYEIDKDWTLPSNVFCAVYQEELAGYMAGYLAVKEGYKHLGFLGGMAVPAVIRFGFGFVQGANDAAKELNTAITIEYIYGGQFYGDASITAVMDTWYQEKGVEVVFACGGGIYTSAAEAAKKVNKKVIGVDVDQSATIDGTYGAGMTITSAMKGLSATVQSVLEIIICNKWNTIGGSISTLGLVSKTDVTKNFVQLPYDTTVWTSSFSKADYVALVGKLFDKTITVSNDTSAMPKVNSLVTVNTYANIK